MDRRRCIMRWRTVISRQSMHCCCEVHRSVLAIRASVLRSRWPSTLATLLASRFHRPLSVFENGLLLGLILFVSWHLIVVQHWPTVIRKMITHHHLHHQRKFIAHYYFLIILSTKIRGSGRGDGRRLLHVAAAHGYNRIIDILLAYGFDFSEFLSVIVHLLLLFIRSWYWITRYRRQYATLTRCIQWKR